MGADGELQFRGPNACHGQLTQHGYERLPADVWRTTGDRARHCPDGTWVFEGRCIPAFKLRNGRWMDAVSLEATLRALPGVEDVVIAADGQGGFMAILEADAEAPWAARVADVCGSLAAHLFGVHTLPSSEWPRTTKGATDRPAILRRFTRA